MTREIKFRAWHKKYKEMLSICEINFGSEHYFFCELLSDGETNWGTKSDIQLMQYTGLKDKNGKEIYEGDIVRFDLYKGERIEAIEWENIGKHTAFGAGTHNATVIGNIYENPELVA